MDRTRIHSFHLESGAGSIFATYHEPGGDSPAPGAVLICAPWGWDEVASYRPRRAWAQRLAESGRPVLRFDLPGSGDSAGSPRDPNLVSAWVVAVKTAAGWLRDRAGVASVTALGLGFGGLAAMAALEEGGPIDQLILWASPLSGRSFVQGARRFAQLQAWGADAGSGAGQLPPGAIEASGFLLSEETIRSLEGLEPSGELGGNLRRALLLGRNAEFQRGPLSERLEAAGTEVTIGAGRGWGRLVSQPERSRLSDEAVAIVGDWLDRGDDPPAEPPSGTGGAAPVEPEGTLVSATVKETPFPVEHSFGRSFGILAEPAVAPPTPVDLCAVYLNAGAVRHTGPNRMWVERSREWAARGVPCLRLDVEGIGDADGDPDGIPPGEEFFSARFEAQVATVLDALRGRGLGPRFMLVGLCSGGYFAYRATLADADVRSAFLINPGALVWRPGLVVDRETRKAARVVDPTWLGRVAKGEVEWHKVRSLVASLARRALRRLGQAVGLTERPRSMPDQLGAELDRLEGSGVRLVMAFSSGEPLYGELEEEGLLADLQRRPGLSMPDLPGGDHTLRPLEAQAALRELLAAELERALGAEGGSATDPPVASVEPVEPAA